MSVQFTPLTLSWASSGTPNPLSINDTGEIVGEYIALSYPGGFSYHDGSYSSVFYPGAQGSSAKGINASGQIAGAWYFYSAIQVAPVNAFTEEDGLYTGFSNTGWSQIEFVGINDYGQIVGDHDGHVFTKTGSILQTIDYPGASTTYAKDIDNNGNIIGSYTDAAGTHSFLDVDGTFTTIVYPGALSTVAQGMNNSDQIAGYFVDRAGATHGFIETNGTFEVVDAPNAVATYVDDINDLGQIVGTYTDTKGVHAFTTSEHLNAVYRFYDTSTDDHFYTTSPAEKAAIQSNLPTFTYEGAPWYTPDKGTNTIDVYRFYDTATKTHFFTSNAGERDTIQQTIPSFRYEGIAFQAYASAQTGDQFALERFYNTSTKVHTYAADATEVAAIKSGVVGQGWVDEGSSFIVHHVPESLLIT